MDRRPVDRMAFISGLVFVVVGVVFLLERLGVISVPPSFVLPVVLVALGVGLLVGRRPDEAREPGPTADVEPPYAPPSSVDDETLPEPSTPEKPASQAPDDD